MASSDRDRAARTGGDVVRGALAPMTGAVLGAVLGVASSAASTGAALAALMRESLAGERTPAALLETVPGLLLRAAGPALLGAFAGAAALGLLQARAFGPLGEPTGLEPRAPSAPLALLGWVALAVLVLDALRLVLRLHPGASPFAIGGAAVEIAAHIARGALVVLGVLGLADHLLRVRARRQRLGLDEPQVTRRAPYAAPVVDERLDALVAGAQLVLYDEDRAIALVRGEGGWTILARARGLSGVALREAARRRALPLRATPALEALDGIALGVPLSTGEVARIGLREMVA